MDGGKLSAAIGVGLLCAGCASVEWPTPQEEVAVWLHEQPRVLAVQVDPELPDPQVRVRDHKAGERVGKQRTDIHVVVVRLLFGRDQRECVELGQRQSSRAIERPA